MGLEQPVYNMPIGAGSYNSFWRIYGFTVESMSILIPDGEWVTNFGNYEAGNQHLTLDGPLWNGSRDARSIGQIWSRPMVESEIAYEPKFVDSMSGKRFGYGGKRVMMKMQNYSPYQFDYFWNRIAQRKYSVDGSMVIYNRLTNSIEAYNGIIRFPDPKEIDMSNGGFANFTVELANAVEMDNGAVLVLSGSGNAYVTLNIPDAQLSQYSWSEPLSKKSIVYNATSGVATGSHSLYFKNVGDTATYDSVGYESPIVVTYLLESGEFSVNTLFFASGGILGTLEYTDDYGASWFGTSPVAPINGVRITATNPITVNQFLGFTMNITFNTAGTFKGTLSHSAYYNSYPLDQSRPIYINVV